MNVPIPNTSSKIPPLIAVVAISLMAGAYFIFLYATWQQFQNDRARREQRIDEILDRLPPKISDNTSPVTAEVNKDGV